MEPDGNQNLTIRVMLFLFVGMFLANTVAQFLNIDYKEPVYLFTLIVPVCATVVYAYYKRALPHQEHILIVEDKAIWITLIKFSLKTDPPRYRTTVCRSAEEALELLNNSDASELPSQIILDLALPGMDGGKFLKKLKADPRLELIPVTILTVAAQVDDVDLKLASNWVNKLEGSAGLMKALSTEGVGKPSLVTRLLSQVPKSKP